MRTFIKRMLGGCAVALITSLGSAASFGHAISIGYENAGPGSVNIWLGTYQHGGHHLEGSLQLQGVSGTVFGPVVTPFTQLTGDGIAHKPAGLIDGVTNFYVSTSLGVPGPLVGDDTIWNTVLCPACGPANHWQGVTFNGLTPGDYQFTYVPIANPTAEWTPYNPSLNGTFNLSGQVINPGNVPTPAAIGLFALGLLGVGFGLRRRKRQEP